MVEVLWHDVGRLCRFHFGRCYRGLCGGGLRARLLLAGAATSTIFVATSACLSRQKHTFVATYFCRDKRRVLSRQTSVCRDETFIATKMILMAAPTNDRDAQRSCFCR